MIRFLAILLALFALPFVIFRLLAWWRMRNLPADVRIVYPWVTLSVIGLVLVLAGFLGLSNFAGGSPGSHYIPAHVENGVFVPGRFVDP
jgi:hypothetical protein